MIDNKRREKVSMKKNNLFFYLAYTILIVYRILRSSTIEIDDKGMTYIFVSFLFLFNIFQLKVSKTKLISVCLISFIVLLCIKNTMDPVLPVVLLAFIASQNIKFKNIAKISFFVTSFLVLGVVLLASLGLIEDTQSFRYFGETEIVCHGMGFHHSSALPTYYCFLFLNYMYLFPKKRKLLNIFMWILGGYFIFTLCAERLRFFMLFIASSFIIIEPFICDRYAKLKNIIMILVFPICCFVTLLLGYNYNPSNHFLRELNINLSNRLYFENYAFNNYQITWFGQDILMGENVTKFGDGTTYFYLDSAYVYLLFEYGIFVFLAIMLVYIYGCKKAFKLKNDFLCMWFIILAIDSMIGNQVLSIWCIPIIFIPFCDANSIDKLDNTTKLLD